MLYAVSLLITCHRAGFAYKEFEGKDITLYKKDDTSYPTKDLVFAGLISLVDPPKGELSCCHCSVKRQQIAYMGIGYGLSEKPHIPCGCVQMVWKMLWMSAGMHTSK